ncbi:25271_t:CDS:2, partial [Dentiscutata erythropus]
MEKSQKGVGVDNNKMALEWSVKSAEMIESEGYVVDSDNRLLNRKFSSDSKL